MTEATSPIGRSSWSLGGWWLAASAALLNAALWAMAVAFAALASALAFLAWVALSFASKISWSHRSRSSFNPPTGLITGPSDDLQTHHVEKL